MQESSFYRKNETFLIALLFFLLNFILKILFVSKNEIAMDEPFSIYYAQMDLPSIFKMLKTENNPALHFILLHYWIKLFGMSPFSVRFLSVLFSALTAPVIYFTGKKFFSNSTGIIASLTYTLSVFHIFFSHEARVYPIFVFLTALSLYCFLSLVEKPGKWKSSAALLIVNILLVYAHYFGFFVVATEMICVFFSGKLRNIWKKMSLVFLLIAILYIPNLIVFTKRFTVSVEHGTWVRKPEFTELYGNLNRFLNSRIVMLVLIVIMVFYAIRLIKNHQLSGKFYEFFKSSQRRILFVWFVFPYFAMFAVSFFAPMFLDRYLLYTSVGFYLLVALTLTFFAESKKTMFVAAGLFIITIACFTNPAPDNERRVGQVVENVNKLKASFPESLVLISPDYAHLEFTYHYNPGYFRDYKNTTALLKHDNIYPVRDLSGFDKKELATRTIIYVNCGAEFAFGENPVLDELTSSHSLLKEIPVFEIYRIYCFMPK